jgi:butyryl-CoA dehydrogenase
MVLDEQQTMIRDIARQFARQRLAPFAARWDRESHFPIDENREMGRLGLMGINVPVEWGGAGADQVSTALALGGNCGRRRRNRDGDERAQFGWLHADCQIWH